MYNMTNVTSANNIIEIVKGVNDPSNGGLILLLCMTLFIILMVTYGRNNFKAALLAGAFMMVLICVPLFIIGWIGMEILILPILMVVAAILTYMFVD